MPTIRKRGKTWQVQIRIKEEGAVVYQESATRDTKAAALLWGLSREEEIEKHGWQKRVESRVTVKKLMQDYTDLKYRSKAVSRGIQHSLDNVAYDADLGDLTLSELTSAVVVKWAVKKQKAGSAPATVMHHLAMLRAAMNAAPGLFSIKADVTPLKEAIVALKQIQVIAPSRKRDQRVTEADLAEIIPMFGAAVIPMEAIVRLAVALPRRREELLTMQRKHLSRDGDTIRLIDTKDPRKYREEVVPVPPPALEILKALPRHAGDDRFLPYKPESVSAAWQRAVRKVGKPELRLHDLRHEGISRLFEQGLSIEEVALISGHTSWTTLKRYTHLRPQDVAAKLRRSA